MEQQSTEQSLAITACDTFEGQVLAHKLADYLEEHFTDPDDHTKQLICLARDSEKTGDLKSRPNCKVVQMSYDDPNSITIAIRGIQTLVLVPEIEGQRVDWAYRMVDVMTQESVARCILISGIGTDAAEKKHLNQFAQVEEKVKESMKRWTILRQGFPFQDLLYWIPMIHDQGVLGMSISPEVKFSPLHISNLGDALVSVTYPSSNCGDDHPGDQALDCNHGKQGEKDAGADTVHDKRPPLSTLKDKRFDGQTYTLTGPETTTGTKLVKELNKILSARLERNSNAESTSDHQNNDVPTPIVYKCLSRDEMRTYLLTLRDRDKAHDRQADSTRQLESMDMRSVLGALRMFQQATMAAFGNIGSQRGSSTARAPHSAPLSRYDAGHRGTTSKEVKEVVSRGVDEAKADRKNDPCRNPKRPQLPDEPIEPEVPESPGPGGPDHPQEPETPEPPKPRKPILRPPNDAEVELILDLLDYINEGRATFQSGDLQKVAGIRGANAKDFFEEYKEDFAKPARTL
ncbi:hypothetical protein BGX31_010152 [Mortierella sp. GBA43]|nr:hypothetical protein BGX31_010152 [Mortierella sp. GBA43]